MGTKLKRISFSCVTKTIAFLLIIIFFGFGISELIGLERNTHGIEPLLHPNYINSSEMLGYEQNFCIGLNNLLSLKNEEYIKQGNTIDKATFESGKQQLFYEWYSQINGGSDGSLANTYNLLKDRFESENADKINEIYNSMIDEQLNSYHTLLQKVNKKEGLYYYATDGANVFTNCNQNEQSFFKKFNAYYISDITGAEYFPDSMNKSYILNTSGNVNNKIYIAVTDQYLSKMQAEWDKQHVLLQDKLTTILCSVFIILAALIYFIWSSGRKSSDENIHMIFIDKIYTDLNVFMIFCTILAWFACSMVILREIYHNIDIQNMQFNFWFMFLYNVAFCSIGLTLFLSLIRHCKNKTLFKYSIVYKISSKILDAGRIIYNMAPLSLKIAAIILISEFATFIFTIIAFTTHSVFALFWLFLLSIFTVWWIYYLIVRVKPFSEIKKGVREIKNGKLDYVINVQGEGDLAKLADDINDITDGLKNAVAKETKAERMKAELITNVSHDLKTPLTSIINYADLLSKEKLIPETANDYVAVVKQKSEKLKTLTQDLFEISKVQSGNISVDLEKIDISVLIRQSLAEFDEQLVSSGLDFKVTIQNTNLNILADGKRLSRVFENLIGNILKYSLNNTRVYIDVFSDDDNVFIEFKNIANYEMNFKEDEILERFVRGDKSRSTEGNGLGLAIAQSYVEACGGRIKISVDGDLFKVTIKFSKE